MLLLGTDSIPIMELKQGLQVESLAMPIGKTVLTILFKLALTIKVKKLLELKP
jgi:hypothetical protein